MRCALIALSVAAAATAAAAQAPWTVEQMAADLDEIAAAVRGSWSYFEDHRQHFGVDVDALLAAAKSALPDVQSADDFGRVLRRFAAGLQDGHAWSRVPGERPPARVLPFRLADCREGLVVTAVADGVQRPRRGDLLVAIAGTAAGELVAEQSREVCGSTPGMRRRLAIKRLLRHDDTTVDCTFESVDGTRAEVAVATLPSGSDVPPAREQPANWAVTWPRERTALLHLSSFAVPRWQEWLAAKPEAREPFLAEGRARIDAIVAELDDAHAEALILDLRGNGGGTDSLGIHLAERLLADPFVYFLLAAQRDGRWPPPQGLTYGTGEHARFAGRVIALVDEGSFSTTDNVLRCLDALHEDFTTVGRPSGGGTGAPRQLVQATHSKAVLGACTQRVHDPRGRLTEGRGTVPDVPVTWTRDDWLAGRDPDLAAALALLERDAGGNDSGGGTGSGSTGTGR